MTKEELKKKIDDSRDGREIWLDLMQKHSLDNKDYVVLLPSCNSECNYYACLYLEEFLRQKNADKAIILTHDERVIQNIALFSKAKAVAFSRIEAQKLMQFYCLYQFTDKLIIASLDEPNGRNADKLVGKNGLDTRKIVVYGIYGMSGFEIEKFNTPEFGRDIFE